MVYIKYTNFRSGQFPSKARDMALKFKYVKPENKDSWEAKYFQVLSTDKLTLARNRIWGNVLTGDVKTGHNWFKKDWKVRRMNNDYQFTQMRNHFPGLRDFEKKAYLMEKYHYRKLRSEMRNMKVGSKSVDLTEGSTMAMFELKAKGMAGGNR